MVLNEEERAIINRAFEQLPFVVSKYLSFPVTNPLDAEAIEYNARASKTNSPELFDENGQANNVVDGRKSKEVLKFCSFFEHCRRSYKKETLQDKRQQVHIFSTVLPFLEKENRQIAEKYIQDLEKNFPENVVARNIVEAEKAIKRMTSDDFHAQFEVDKAIKSFGGNVPDKIAKLYDHTVTEISLRKISSLAEAENIVYVLQQDFDNLFDLSKKTSPESQEQIQRKFSAMITAQFEKSYKLIADENDDLKKHKDDYIYNKDRERVQQSALRYTQLFCKYADCITQQYGTSPKADTLCNYALKMASLAYPPRSAKCYDLKSYISFAQSQAYKKLKSNPLAELLSKFHECDHRLFGINADLARYSYADRDPKINRRIEDGNAHNRILNEKLRINEQIKIYRSISSSKGRSNV